MSYAVRLLALAGILSAFSISALAHDSSSSANGSMSSTVATPDLLEKARGLIAAKQWQSAIAELQQVNAPHDADWNNLMGYSFRKSDPPDLPNAEKFYSAALAINPKHLGTLEYLGEMRLQQGDLAGAEQQLVSLRKATFLKTDEFKDLQAAIKKYKALGNKYIPAD